MPIVYLGLGSNLGDRAKNIHEAVRLLNETGVITIQLSSVIETDPVGGPPQGLFLNAALKAQTELSPTELLKAAHSVEAELGRVRTVRNGPRTVDVDILRYDDLTMNTPELVIPHPRMREREFVMRSLREVGGV